MYVPTVEKNGNTAIIDTGIESIAYSAKCALLVVRGRDSYSHGINFVGFISVQNSSTSLGAGSLTILCGDNITHSESLDSNNRVTITITMPNSVSTIVPIIIYPE